MHVVLFASLFKALSAAAFAALLMNFLVIFNDHTSFLAYRLSLNRLISILHVEMQINRAKMQKIQMSQIKSM